MNYIDLINDFWRFYDENKSKINVSDIVLYKVLLRYCNKIGWVNPFTINPYLMHEINPLSVNTYYKSFKNLNNLNVIKWTKGKHNVSNQSVTILNINNSTTTSVNNSIDNSIKFSTTNSLVNNNKTIIQLDNKTIKQLKKGDFDFLISSKEFLNYLKKEELKLENIISNKEVIYLSNLKKETWLLWSEYKKTQFKFTYKSKVSEQVAIDQLIKLSNDNDSLANKIINNSISQGYKGLFELKTNGIEQTSPKLKLL